MENMFSLLMLKEFFSLLNIWAVLSSAVLFFGLGFVWYTPLFGQAWRDEMKNHGVTLSKEGNGMKMGMLFVCYLVAALGMAFISYHAGTFSWMAGMKIGIIISAIFIVPLFAVNYMMEGKSMKLFLIDTVYTCLGIVLMAIVLGAWTIEQP